MTEALLLFALFLLINLLIGLWRAVIGPTTANRLIAAQVLATTGIAVLLLLAEATGARAARDVALLMALLAVILTVAFVRRLFPDSAGGAGDR